MKEWEGRGTEGQSAVSSSSCLTFLFYTQATRQAWPCLLTISLARLDPRIT